MRTFFLVFFTFLALTGKGFAVDQELEDRFKKLEDASRRANLGLQKLEDEVDRISRRVDHLRSQVDSLESEVNDTEADLDHLKSRVSNIRQ